MGTEIIRVTDRHDFAVSYVMLPDGTVRPPMSLQDFFYWTTMGGSVFGWYMIARTTIGDVRVQTDFIHIDHGWRLDHKFVFDPSADIRYATEPPLGYQPTCFETMVFGGPMHLFQKRYKTLRKARFGHKRVVLSVRHALAQEETPLPEEPPQGRDPDFYGPFL